MVKVLVVDDSAVARQLVSHILTTNGIEVIGVAASGYEALAFLKTNRPDIITMDVHMPGLDGLEVTRRIMESDPIPILIVTGHDRKALDRPFRFLDCGAVGVISRPPGPMDPGFTQASLELIRSVKALSEVRLIRRRSKPAGATTVKATARRSIKCVAIGASTGGPQALKELLSNLPKDYSCPILIAQHISTGFTEGLVHWLAESGRNVRLGLDREIIRDGNVYVAPDDYHMLITAGGAIKLSKAEREHGMRPSVSVLYRSVLKAYGADCAAVQLTGMGTDGALELKQLNDAGALTFAQDRETCVVFGMPGAAIELRAAQHIMNPAAIGQYLGICPVAVPPDESST